ncbi:MAG: hypothetical protein WBP93_17065 [Pyrinomonadaceae bacterium]
MKTRKRALWLIFALLAIAMVAAMTSLNGQSKSNNAQQKNTDESQMPIVDYSTSEPSAQEKQTKRYAKGLRYNNLPAKVEEFPGDVEVTEAESWIERLPALPVSKSDAIVLGRVTNTQAFLSPDKSGVYSEFKIEINEILKDKSGASLVPNMELIAEREGGRIRFPSGHVQLFRLSGQGALHVGGRYLLFLKCTEQPTDFLLLTAYELRGGRVYPIDDVTRHAVYKGSDETTFLNTVRKAITDSSQVSVGGEKQSR